MTVVADVFPVSLVTQIPAQKALALSCDLSHHINIIVHGMPPSPFDAQLGTVGKHIGVSFFIVDEVTCVHPIMCLPWRKFPQHQRGWRSTMTKRHSPFTLLIIPRWPVKHTEAHFSFAYKYGSKNVLTLLRTNYQKWNKFKKMDWLVVAFFFICSNDIPSRPFFNFYDDRHQNDPG